VGDNHVGKMSTEEVLVDNKGRILIPKNIREKIGLETGTKAQLKIENHKLFIQPPTQPEEFIQEMEGCIKEGTPALDPLDLKKIWDPADNKAKKP